MDLIRKLNHTDEFPISPIECFKLNVIAYYLCALLVASAMVNSVVLLAFFVSKELRSPINTFVMCITALNLFGSITELPFVIGSNFACRFIYSKIIYLFFKASYIHFCKDGFSKNLAVCCRLFSCTL